VVGVDVEASVVGRCIFKLDVSDKDKIQNSESALYQCFASNHVDLQHFHVKWFMSRE
jgi:hypothetical protein